MSPPGRIVAALVAAAALLAGCGQGAPKLPRLAPEAVILAFGDSLTFGTGASPETNYPASLEKLVGRTVRAAGVPGEVSATGLARLPSAIEQYKPALLILCHGGNDFLRKLDEKQAAQNVRAMVRLARDSGVDVVLIGVPKPGLMPSPAGFYAEIAKEMKLPYEDTSLKKIMTDNELKSDLVHPNAKGYARMAEAVAALLKKSGAI